jgi:hypothetical protein
MHKSFMWSLLFRLFNQNFVCILIYPFMLHVSFFSALLMLIILIIFGLFPKAEVIQYCENYIKYEVLCCVIFVIPHITLCFSVPDIFWTNLFSDTCRLYSSVEAESCYNVCWYQKL